MAGSKVTTVGIWAAAFEVIAITSNRFSPPRFYAVALKPLPAPATTGSLGLTTVTVAVTGTIAILSAELSTRRGNV